MPTRLQIARARARVSLARRSGEPLADTVRAIAAVDFADADDATPVVKHHRPKANPRRFSFGVLAGEHAAGHDYGPHDSPPRPQTGPQPTDSDRESLTTPSAHSRDEEATAEAATARGELDNLERLTDQEAMSAALSVDEAADWLDVGPGRVLTDLAFGDLFAFVSDDEQFTDDPEYPVLEHLSWLAAAFGDAMHPASILGFMTTPHPETPLGGQAAMPVEWLTAHRDVQPLLDLLERRLWT